MVDGFSQKGKEKAGGSRVFKDSLENSELLRPAVRAKEGLNDYLEDSCEASDTSELGRLVAGSAIEEAAAAFSCSRAILRSCKGIVTGNVKVSVGPKFLI